MVRVLPTPRLCRYNDNWWRQPEFADDFHNNGEKAQKWLAAKLPVAEANEGQSDPAPAEEKKKRVAWYGLTTTVPFVSFVLCCM